MNVGMLLSRPKNLANPLTSYEHMAQTQAVSTSDVLSPNPKLWEDCAQNKVHTIGQLHEMYFKDRIQFISVLEQAICTTQTKKMSNKLKKNRNILQNKNHSATVKLYFSYASCTAL